MLRTSLHRRCSKANQQQLLSLQPTLIGNLLNLSPVRAQDYDDLFQVARDEKIWEQHPVWNRYKSEVFRIFFDHGLASGGQLVVRENKSKKVIGSTRFYDYEPEEKSVAIGYTYLARSYWGGVYNKEMKKLLLDHAFLHCDRVWFHIGSKNIRSRTAMERVGGVLRHETTSDPKWSKKDTAYYFIDRNSYHQNK